VQRVLAPALLLLSVFVLPAAAQRFDHDEVIEETFKVGPGRMLSIYADLGSIEVRGGGRDVRVTVIKGVNDVSRREAEALFDRYRVEMRETREGVEIIGRRRDRASWWRRNQLQVRYRITVPERFNVDLRTAGGSIEIADLDGKARIKTSGGSLRVDNVAGPVEAETSGGSITARRLGDDARLHTSGGAITVEDAGGRIDANTSGGSIRVTFFSKSVLEIGSVFCPNACAAAPATARTVSSVRVQGLGTEMPVWLVAFVETSCTYTIALLLMESIIFPALMSSSCTLARAISSPSCVPEMLRSRLLIPPSGEHRYAPSSSYRVLGTSQHLGGK